MKQYSGLVTDNIGLAGVVGFLFTTQQSVLRYIVKASMLVVLNGLLLSQLLVRLLPEVPMVIDKVDLVAEVYTVVLFGPFFETLMMVVIFWIIGWFTKNLLATALISALVWALLHGISFPIQGIINFFSFFVYSIAYLIWRPLSFWRAFGITSAIHMINNAVIVLLVFFLE